MSRPLKISSKEEFIKLSIIKFKNKFNGTMWHSHPSFYPSKEYHPIRKNFTNGEIYNKTLLKEKIIKEAGYKLIVMWEHDWDNHLKEKV